MSRIPNIWKPFIFGPWKSHAKYRPAQIPALTNSGRTQPRAIPIAADPTLVAQNSSYTHSMQQPHPTHSASSPHLHDPLSSPTPGWLRLRGYPLHHSPNISPAEYSSSMHRTPIPWSGMGLVAWGLAYTTAPSWPCLKWSTNTSALSTNMCTYLPQNILNNWLWLGCSFVLLAPSLTHAPRLATSRGPSPPSPSLLCLVAHIPPVHLTLFFPSMHCDKFCAFACLLTISL